MSMTVSGRGKCDGCGLLQDNTGVQFFVIISYLDDDGIPAVKHYCLANGCAATIMEAGENISDGS